MYSNDSEILSTTASFILEIKTNLSNALFNTFTSLSLRLIIGWLLNSILIFLSVVLYSSIFVADIYKLSLTSPFGFIFSIAFSFIISFVIRKFGAFICEKLSLSFSSFLALSTKVLINSFNLFKLFLILSMVSFSSGKTLSIIGISPKSFSLSFIIDIIKF